MDEKPENSSRDNLHEESDVTPRFGINDSSKGVYDDASKPQANLPSDPTTDSASNDGGVIPRDKLKEKEKQANFDSGSKANGPEKDKFKVSLDNALPAGRFAKILTRLTSNPRRKTAGVVAAGVITFGIIMGFSTIQGPLKAVHLAQNLSLPQHSQDGINEKRMVKMYRYMRSGELGHTRVGVTGSLMYSRTSAKLKAQGITIGSEGGRQRLGDITIDINKAPGLEGLTYDEKLDKLSQDFKLTRQEMVVRGSGEVTLPKEKISISSNRTIAKTLGLSNMGTVSRGMNARNYAKWFGEYSWFHPMQKTQENAASKIDSYVERVKKARTDAEKVTEQTPEEKSKIAKFKEQASASKSLKIGASALAIQGAICSLRDVAHGIAVVQYISAVLPAEKGALKYMGLGNQVMSGDDFKLNTVGDELSALKDDQGNDVFAAKSLNALSGSNKGTDLDEGIKSAFSNENTASEILDATDSIPGVEAACSPLGQAAGTVIGLGVLLVSGGTGQFIIKGATSTVSSVVINRVLGYVEQLFAKDLAKSVMSGGPLGGNLLAHGAMALAGSSARSFGGVAFSTIASNDVRAQRIAEYKQEFENEPFTKRVFDVNDSRSVAASIIDSPNISTSNSLSNMASVFSIKNLFSGFSTMFNTKASAATQSNYDWPMPEYGFSDSVMNDQKYDDPYENADKVAALIDNGDYKDRAKTCFGATIAQDSSGNLNVTTDEETNPASSEYHKANCGDTSEEWTRIRLFILDTKNMNALYCYEGDDSDSNAQQACADVGQTRTTQASTNETTQNDTEPIANCNTNSGPLTKWPTQPFDQAHIVRASFGGEPRAYISASGSVIRSGDIVPFLDNRLAATKNGVDHRGLHHGIDIVAPDNTVVYSLQDGVVQKGSYTSGDTVRVGQFEYTHLKDMPAVGTTVKAFETPIGKIKDSEEHVHLTYYPNNSSTEPLNPLTKLQFAGYCDKNAPKFSNDWLKVLNSSNDKYKKGAGGNVELFADAYDISATKSQYNGGQEPKTGISKISATIKDGNQVIQTGILWDFSNKLPNESEGVWIFSPFSDRVRAKIAEKKEDYTNFEYRLTRNSPLKVKPGSKYTIEVIIEDSFGNKTTDTASFEG